MAVARPKPARVRWEGDRANPRCLSIGVEMDRYLRWRAARDNKGISALLAEWIAEHAAADGWPVDLTPTLVGGDREAA